MLCAVAGATAGDICNSQFPERPINKIIYMIGDGMGVAQVSALMTEGDYAPLNMERATAVGLVKTRSANNRVTDSAAAGTALATGTKTDNNRLGIDPEGNELRSLMDLARDKGWKRGLVVTTHITHATPAAFYAHVYKRSSYDSIAMQLMSAGIDVAMGGGRDYFDPEKRADRKDLLAQFGAMGYNVAFDMAQAEKTDSGRLVALLAPGSMAYSQDGRGDYLPQATAHALDILTRNSDDEGFFLMVEGSMIDYAGHDNDIERVVSEMRDFDKAVGVAFDYADSHPGTLVIVTADHETGGLGIGSANEDYAAGESGLDYGFTTGGHTASMVPLFAYGSSANFFSKVFDNTELAGMIGVMMNGGLRVKYGLEEPEPDAEE